MTTEPMPTGGETRPEPMHTRSEWARIQLETRQHHELRRESIGKLQKHFPEFEVLSYYTAPDSEEAMIDDNDVEVIEELLAARPSPKPVLLVVSSQGGDALAAERIANVCRAHGGGRFEVAVPHMAKSAATIICFGADKIHMSVTAELGPVDPQIPQHSDRGGLLWISADELLRSYDELLKQATSDPAVLRVEPFLQQLQRYDSRRIEQIRSFTKLSEDISAKLLACSQMKGVSEDDIKKKIKMFLQQSEKISHGRRIGIDDAASCGLKIQTMALDSAAWKDLWKLHQRTTWWVQQGGALKIMETANDSIIRANLEG